MTVIRPNSISGVTSITAQGGGINIFRSSGAAGDLTINNIVGAAATFTGVLTYEDVTNVDSVGLITARGGIRIGAGTTVGPVSGIVTYFGDGSQLTGISAGVSLSGSTDNTVCTVTGANAIQGESNLFFNGSQLGVNVTPDSGVHLHVQNSGEANMILEGDVNGVGGFLMLKNNNATANTSMAIQFLDAGGQGTSEIKGVYADNSNNEGYLTFSTRPSGGSMTERLRISSAGIVTKPAHPMLSMTVSSNLLSGNYMTHNSVLTNNGNHYNTSTSKFVCPVAGFYYASIMVMSNNSNTTMDLELHINGSNANNILVPYQAATGGQYNQVSGSCILQCAANAELQFKLNSGSIYNGRHSNITFALFA